MAQLAGSSQLELRSLRSQAIDRWLQHRMRNSMPFPGLGGYTGVFISLQTHICLEKKVGTFNLPFKWDHFLAGVVA